MARDEARPRRSIFFIVSSPRRGGPPCAARFPAARRPDALARSQSSLIRVNTRPGSGETELAEFANQPAREQVVRSLAFGKVRRRILLLQVAPSLMRAFGHRVHEPQLAFQPDRPASVGSP